MRRYRFQEALYPHELAAWLGDASAYSRMRMNAKSYSFLRAWARDILDFETDTAALKQGIWGTFLGVQVRIARTVRDGDVFVVPRGSDVDLNEDWAPYAEEDAQRVSRYERIMEED